MIHSIFIRHPKFALILLYVISLVVTMIIFVPTLEIAKRKQIVDNPEARKLQKEPIPILGGVVVFFGISVGLMFFKTMFYQTALLPVLAAMVTMLYIGTIDDIVNLSPSLRMMVEIGVAALMIYGSRSCIMNFQNLWGIDSLAVAIAVPLTIFTIVGIINALNMIDGVDGLLSGMGMLICGCFGLLAFLAHDYSNASLAAVTIGSLTTFFLHNVFGEKSKMFLGDGGSMLLGIIVSWMIINVLGGHFLLAEYHPAIASRFGLIAFSLAVVSVPVGDTLRVMAGRILRKQSPFKPDNTHLHHLFVRLGFSHLGTTFCIIGLDALIIIIMVASWWLGASIQWQLYITIICIAIFDGGLAFLLNKLSGRDGAYSFRKIGDGTQTDKKGLWRSIQKAIDGE